MTYSEYEQEGGNYTRQKFSIFVFPRLQIRLIGIVFAAASGSLLMASWAFYYLIYRQFERVLGLSTLNEAQKLEQMNNLSFSLTYLLIVGLFFAAVMTGLSFYLSRRIAGPIYNMSKVIERFLAGDRNAQVVLRKGDEFIILSDKINDLFNYAKKNPSVNNERTMKASGQ